MGLFSPPHKFHTEFEYKLKKKHVLIYSRLLCGCRSVQTCCVLAVCQSGVCISCIVYRVQCARAQLVEYTVIL